MSFRFNQGDRPLPGYTIQRGVGRGGFGEVYYSLSDGGKEVALKYLRENPQVELRGATHCLNLKSPYLIALHDIKQSAAGEFFVIMEYVNGVSLRDLMNEAPRGLGVQKAAYFAREIAKGLAYLHDRGIVHRDLKPGNIFYEDGYVKIGDYGLSKMMAASQHSGQTVSVGTVHYMAPEVGSGNYDRTIDIYALGVILYEMVLGRVPFSGASMGEVLMKHLTASPEVDELPAPFPNVIRKALAKDPRDRYQTVNEMIADLFEVEDLDRSVAAFEPASITLLAANAAKNMGAGGHAAGTALGTGSSNVGHFQGPLPPVIGPAGENRIGAGRNDPGGDRAPGGSDEFMGLRAEVAVPKEIASWLGTGWPMPAIGKALISCAATAGAATVIGHGDFPYWLTIFLHSVCIVQSMFLWQIWTIRGGKAREEWTATLAFIVIAGVTVALVNNFTFDLGLIHAAASDLVAPLIAALVICDWRGRLDEGRRGVVSLGSAMWLAIFGYIAAKIADADEVSVMAILAGASLGVQSLGGLWPMQVGPKSGKKKKHENDGNAPAFADGQSQGYAGTVAVSRDGLNNRMGRNRFASNGHSPLHGAERTSLPQRSSVVRSIWFIAAGILGLASVLCYIALGVMNMRDDEWVGTLIGGVALSHFTIFALSCAAPRLQKGLWRGIFRKGIFFAGLALSSGSGIYIGQFNPQREDLFAALTLILLGVVTAVLVWIIPVPMPKFMKEAASNPTDAESAERARKSRIMRTVALSLWGLAILLIPILLISVPERDWDEVFPATMVPLGVTGAALFFGSLAAGRAKRKEKKPAVELPLKRSLRVESVTHLRRMLEQYAFLKGYRMDSHGELLWRFLRGDWTAQFWQSDVRKWKTELNIVAYEDGQGGYRTTCQLDVDSRFNSPDRTMLLKLNEEMDELQSMLEGSGSPIGREILA